VLTGEIAPYLGGASILGAGAIHAQQYYQAYFSAVPTTGILFLLSTRSRRSAGAEPEEVHVS